jgi:serine/threonine protein phosphatase PrpC
MSRSFGDQVASSVGVICDPGKSFPNSSRFVLEISEISLGFNDLFVVIASDGVWEFLSNQEVAEIVHPYYL